MSVTDRKSQNGAGVSRIEMGSGSESTVVQNAKHTSSFISNLKAEYGGRGDSGHRDNIEKYAEHNVQEARSGGKTLRSKSDTVAVPAVPIKGGKPGKPGKGAPVPQAKSKHDEYISAEAKRFKEGGEQIR